MTLLQIRYFCTACRFKNISQAADSLHISQPAVSGAIKELEKEFNVPLIIRKYRGFELTLDGQQFFKLGEELLKQSDQISETMKDLGGRRNTLRIGVSPMIGAVYLPLIYREYTSRYPNITVVTMEKGAHDLAEDVDRELLDLAIIPYDNIVKAKFEIVPLGKFETVYCVSEKHPLAKEKTVSIAQIKDEPLIMFDSGFLQSENVIRRFLQLGIAPNIVHYTGQFYTLQKFISENILTGFMLREAAELSDNIIPISLDAPICGMLGCVYKKYRHLYKNETRFIKVCSEYSWGSMQSSP